MEKAIISMNEKGAILGQPGQYAKPPFLMLPGNPPLEEVTLYDFKVHEIPEPEDVNNIPADYGKELVEVTEKKVKAYTFYCDLDADADWDDTIFWDGQRHTEAEKKACLDARNKNGDGSEQNPWKNLTWALEKIACIINRQCCLYLRLVCSGTAHYTASFHSGIFGGKNIFILEGANIEIEKTKVHTAGSLNIYGFSDLNYTIFLNCNAKIKLNVTFGGYANTAYTYEYGFSGCRESAFLNCLSCLTVNTDRYEDSKGYRGSGAFGYYECENSIFYNCSAQPGSEIETNITNIDFYGFYNLENSILYNCNVDSNIKSKVENYLSTLSFYNIANSVFYNCASNFEGYSSNESQPCGITGFQGCSYSSFYNCIATSENTVIDAHTTGRARGFISCQKSKFYRCNTNVVATENKYGSEDTGFYTGNGSIFYHCKATVRSNGTRSLRSFGFQDSYSSFFNCTTDIILESTGDETYAAEAEAYGFNSWGSIFCNCTANVKVSCITNENESASAIVYGFFTGESNYENISYNISATASAEPDEKGQFYEYEFECGIGYTTECKAGYRCEKRTQEGTESC